MADRSQGAHRVIPQLLQGARAATTETEHRPNPCEKGPPAQLRLTHRAIRERTDIQTPDGAQGRRGKMWKRERFSGAQRE